MQSVQNLNSSLLPILPDGAVPREMSGDEAGFGSALRGGVPASSFLPLAQQGGNGTASAMPDPGAPGGMAPAGAGAMPGAVATGAPGPAGSGAAASVAEGPDAGGAAGDPPDPGIDGSSFQSPEELAKWAPLVQGMPPGQQEAAEKALNRPLAAAEMLKHGSPDEKKAAQAYLDKNPAIKDSLDTSAHGGKPDGDISDHDISAFIGKMTKQRGRAANTIKQYQKDHPDADKQSLQLVRQTALLQAFHPITCAASRKKDDDAGSDVTQDGLKAIAKDNPGLSSALRGAASTFSQPGMFAMLDQGGMEGHDLATHNADGKVSEQNLIDWVSKQAPTTGGQFASTISDAATRNAVADVDTSKLNEDVFKNPQNYSGAQKAAVLVQLQDKQKQLQAGSDLRKNDKTNDAIGKDISQLTSDADVKQYLGQALPGAEKQIVGSDPSLSRAVASTYRDDVSSGKMLRDGLSAVSRNNSDDKNTKQTAGSAVSDFAAQTQLDSDLSDGQTATAQQIVGSSASLTSQLQGDYQRDFAQGGELKQLQGEKDADLGTSLQTTQSDEQAFEGVLDPGFVQAQSGKYQSGMANEAMADGGSGKAVMSALKSGGKADAGDIAKSIAAIDPGQLYGNSKTGLTAGDTQALVSSFLNDLDGGSSVQDACAKFDPSSDKFDGGACDGKVMAKLQGNPAAAQGVQTMLHSLAAGALGVTPPGSPVAAGAGGAAGSAGGQGGSAMAAGPGSTAPGSTAPGSAAVIGGSGGQAAAMPAAASGGDGTAPDMAASGGTLSAPVSEAVAGPGGAAPAAGGGGAAQAASAMAGSTSGTPDAAVSTAQPGLSGAEKAQQGVMYAGLGLGAASMAALPASYANNKYWNNQGAKDGNDAARAARDANASRISMAGEAAGGVGGILGAATMLPGVSQQLKNGQTGEAALSIAGGTRGIIQGGAFAANAGDMAARRMGGASGEIASYALRRGGTLGVTASTAERSVGGRWAGDIVSRTAGQVAGRVGAAVGGEVAGAATAEAIGASVPVVGWIADAAIGIGFIGELIANAVKKAHEKKEMSSTVNPTLKQYGIPEV